MIKAEKFESAIAEFRSGINVLRSLIAAGQPEQNYQVELTELEARIQFVQSLLKQSAK